LLGGLVIAHYGIHQIIWMSVPLLLLAYGMSFMISSSPQKEKENISDDILDQEQLPAAISHF
jgi:DHA1 family inner membrane transport protein